MTTVKANPTTMLGPRVYSANKHVPTMPLNTHNATGNIQQQQQQQQQSQQQPSTAGLAAPTNSNTAERLAQIDELKYFLAMAPDNWDDGTTIKRFKLPTGEEMSCVLYDGLYFITGTDIVRSLTYRFHAFGRPVTNAKKFEEGIFSDLRNLKPGTDARLEEPKSELLDMLYKNNCIRTQKKQKVFYWYSVPHDRLFLDALERDLKREKVDMDPTSVAVAEPATSTSLESTQELFDQLRKSASLHAAAASVLEEDASRCVPTPARPTTLGNGTTMHPRGPGPMAAERGKATTTTTTTPSIRRSRVNSGPASVGHQHHPRPPSAPASPQRSVHGHRALSHHQPMDHEQTTQPRLRGQPQQPQRPRTSLPPSPTQQQRRLPSTLHHARATLYSTVTPIQAFGVPDLAHRGRNDPVARPPTAPSSQTNQQQPRSPTSSSNSSRSLDTNALKKTKAIFGSLSLFDGSPTYKQRRRRAASTSSGAEPVASLAISTRQQNNQVHSAGGPERVRRQVNRPSASVAPYKQPQPQHQPQSQHQHQHQHQHTSAASVSSTVSSASNTTLSSSRLAMAAAAAGFSNTPAPGRQQWPESERTYTCPQQSCGQLFHQLERFDGHLRAHSTQPLMCSLCGKRFLQASLFEQHQKLHNVFRQEEFMEEPHFTPQLDHAKPVFDHSPTAYDTWQQPQQQSDNLCNSNSSRCSTLSPNLDVDLQEADLLPVYSSSSSSHLRSRTGSDDDSSTASSPSAAMQLGTHLYAPPAPAVPSTTTTGPGLRLGHPAYDWIADQQHQQHQHQQHQQHQQYQHQHQHQQAMYPGLLEPSYPVTLLSPFKPDTFPFTYHDADQPYATAGIYPHLATYDPMPMNQESAYYEQPMFDHGLPYQDQMPYTPFVAPTDVTMALV